MSTPDQFRELAHYLKSHTPTKMKLCERSELSVSSESLPQFHTFLKFPVPIAPQIEVGHRVRHAPEQSRNVWSRVGIVCEEVRSFTKDGAGYLGICWICVVRATIISMAGM